MSSSEPALLVVDDNEANRYTLTHRLQRDGYSNIEEAENGLQALEMLRARRFDLVLLDITMPELDGYDVLKQIKSDMDLRDIPVIMISADDKVDSVVRCIELGAEDYLPKPFNAVLLKARVGASLEKKRLKDQELIYRQRLEDERVRSDRLLHALLPMAAVHELKSENTVAPRRFENIAVLFCDVVNFTPFCDMHPPEHVLEHLQTLVARFEELSDEYGLDKIKTIGDAYMAAAGMFQQTNNPMLATVGCGLQMASEAAKLAEGWQVRVGIHSGPVVAGIVGQRQYIFDIWGDTVNTAARIVGKANPGTVIVSGESWLHLRDHCRGRSLGLVPIKGKGQIELVECEGLKQKD
jgi:adenylate cyclase